MGCIERICSDLHFHGAAVCVFYLFSSLYLGVWGELEGWRVMT